MNCSIVAIRLCKAFTIFKGVVMKSKGSTYQFCSKCCSELSYCGFFLLKNPRLLQDAKKSWISIFKLKISTLILDATNLDFLQSNKEHATHCKRKRTFLGKDTTILGLGQIGLIAKMVSISGLEGLAPIDRINKP